MLTEAPKLETIRRNKEQIQMNPLEAKFDNDDELIFDGICATYRSKLPIATQVHGTRRENDHSIPQYSQSKAV